MGSAAHPTGYGSKGRSQPAHLEDATDLSLFRAGPAAATIGASSWAAVPKHSSEPLSHELQDTAVQQN